jgi:hypothetical protein
MVLTFFYLSNSWTLVQVLVHTKLVHLSTSCSLLLSERVSPVR